MVQAVFAVAKGKGKGGGGKFGAAGKGTPAAGGKGDGAQFNGRCHKCNEYGHRINQCPLWGNAAPPNPLWKKNNKGGGKGRKGVNAGTEEQQFFCFMDGPQIANCEPCAPSPLADSRPAEKLIGGAKWFGDECGVNSVVDFPITSTAKESNASSKVKFKPMKKLTQREFRKILMDKKRRDDATWFNAASIKDLRKIADIMENNEVKLHIIDDETESEIPLEVQQEHQQQVDDAPVSDSQIS